MIHPNTTKTVEQYLNEHGSVILSYETPAPIGTVEDINAYNGDGSYLRGQPIVLVREATEAEFLAQDPMLRPDPRRRFYYEVRTD